MCLDGLMYVYQDLYFKNYSITKIFMISWNGTWGFLINLIPIIILNFVPCEGHAQIMCEGDYVEQTSLWLHEVNVSAQLKFALLGAMFSNLTYQSSSYELIKQTSALTRTLLKQIQPIIIWFVAWMLGWEEFIFMQFFGFALIIIGNVVYQQIFYKIYKRQEKDSKTKETGDQTLTETEINEVMNKSTRMELKETFIRDISFLSIDYHDDVDGPSQHQSHHYPHQENELKGIEEEK